MTRIRILAPIAAVLLIAACGKKDANQDASSAGNPGAADAANTTPPPAAPAPASPSGMMGAPAVARQAADSSNAAIQQRANEVNDLSQQAGGSGSGTASGTTP